MKYQPKLSAFYSHQPEVPEGAWPPVKKTQYINLALINNDRTIDFSKEELRQTIRGSIDDVMKDKDDISYDDVLTDVEDGARLLFEGRPGCGKTTMMHKISQDWARETIFSTHLLFLVHLRRFGCRSNIGLADIIRSTTNDFSNEEIENMCTVLEENGGKGVVLVLDGLDEYSPEKRKESFIHNLIEGRCLTNSVVIVASRPAASQKYRRNATTCVEVLGFLRQQIYEYVDCYFPEGDSNNQGLKRYLEHHPNVMHMCYLPLHVAMISYLYGLEGDSLPQTETEIYRHFTLSTLLRSIRRRTDSDVDTAITNFKSFDDLSPDDAEIFQLILEIAFKATVMSKQVFSFDDIKQLISKQKINGHGNDESTLGLIVVDRYYVKYGLEEVFTFLHLTFQEYLAACYIASCSVAEQKSIIHNHAKDKKLQVVWRFYCGMTQFCDEKLNIFTLLISQSSKEVLFHLHCAHESQQIFTCSEVVKALGSNIQLNTSSRYSCTLNPADCTALAYVLINSEIPTDEVSFTLCNIGPEGFNAMAMEAKVKPLPIKSLRFVYPQYL